MNNLLKAIFISSLLSNTYLSYAMDDNYMAEQFGLSVEEYRTQRALYSEAQYAPRLPAEVKKPTQEPIVDLEFKQALADSLGMTLEAYLQGPGKEEELSERKRKEEAATAKFFKREEKQRLGTDLDTQAFLHKLLEEEATQALIRKMQIEDGIVGIGGSLILQNNEKSRELAKGDHRPILENFMGIFHYLGTILQNSDVHVLDQYVFGNGNHILTLTKIGALYNIDNQNLDLAEVGKQMIEFVKEQSDFFNTYKYIDTPVASQTIIGYLNEHFGNMDTEIKSVCPVAREVWSRAWTLAYRLFQETGNTNYIQIIFDQALEGRLTRGGCIEGRIDRGFVGYVMLLGAAGVGLH